MILIIFTIAFVLEAYKDRHIIRAQRVDGVAKDNQAWHNYNAWMMFVIFAFITASTWNLYPLVAACVSRLWVMQVVLNSLRGLKVDHLGGGYIDRLTAKLIGRRGSFLVKSALIIATFIYETLHYETITKEILFHLLPH